MLSSVTKPNTTEQFEIIKSIGVQVKWLNDICLRALAAYNNATQYDAINAAGSYAYFAAVRAMREILCPLGWEMQREQNLEFTVNKKTGIRIIVSSGNKYTGNEFENPKTKNSKGGQTQKIVDENYYHQQLDLPLKVSKTIPNQPEKIKPTWILLHYIDPFKKEMRSELSMPLEIDFKELKVSSWGNRIILPVIKLNSVSSQQYNPNGETDVEFKIERRE
ncbi:MAG: hypothetical protein C4518_10295 [Desulfobacteraceae bacterium]|nr:MAG: hypothetical protein C4518_10295 [Desulfobacteraceae bacterium]